LDEALPRLEAAGNDLALYVAYRARADVAWSRGRIDDAGLAFERADTHARRAGLPKQLVRDRDAARFTGTTPVAEYLAWQDELDPGELRNPALRRRRAVALAMLGRYDQARTLLAELRTERKDRGDKEGLAYALSGSRYVELLDGNPTAALAFLEEAARLINELEQPAHRSTVAALLAHALYATERLEDADAWAGRAAELGASDDAITQILWREARAKVLARRGQHPEAERLAREAVAIGEQTDILDAQADAYADLSEVHLLAGKSDEAAAALEQALERYERKGIVVMAARMRARLAELQATAAR
jgi:tetratricopeptide (TPR) repeat protein